MMLTSLLIQLSEDLSNYLSHALQGLQVVLSLVILLLHSLHLFSEAPHFAVNLLVGQKFLSVLSKCLSSSVLLGHAAPSVVATAQPTNEKLSNCQPRTRKAGNQV